MSVPFWRPARARLRSLLPPNGEQYELFDTAVLLLALGSILYVLTNPPASTSAALPPLRFIDEDTLGLIVTAAAAVGIVAAYLPRYCWVGYIACTTAALAMSANYAFGAIETWQLRPLGSAILYGWIARRLMQNSSS